MTKLLISLLLGLLSASSLSALTISTDAPCNVFVAGKPLLFQVSGAQGRVSYDLTDYYGKKIADGGLNPANGSGTIRVAAQKPCYYELKCTDEKGPVMATLGVVLDRGNKPLPVEGRIGAVACSAWLIKNDGYREPFAKMIRTIGMSWVREPMAWSLTEVEPGKFDWNVYQRVADTLAAQGIYVNHGWTHLPERTHPTNGGIPYPDDYRDLYKYLKVASARFAKYSLTWDVLNEAELTWPLLSDTCAPMQKVSYLGVKAGNPKARVLLASMTHITAQSMSDWGRAGFLEGMYDCGVGDYFDILNHHTYLPAWTYPTDAELHRKMMRRYGVTGKALWLTEAGLGFCGTDGPGEHLINKDAERQQARLVPMSAAMGLVAGNERYFWFCLPDYLENNSAQFGMLHPDITPYPSLVAMSACTNFIGVSRYVGEYCPNSRKSVSYLFTTPKGNVLVAWSDKAMDLAVPTEKPSLSVADIFGAVSEVTAKSGTVTVKVGPDAVYLLDVGKKLLASVSKPRQEPAPFIATPSTVVLAGRGDLPTDRNTNAYKLNAGGVATAGAPFTYTVDVYQFDEKKSASGTVEMVAPENWIVEKPKRTLKLAPMGRETLTFRITPVPTFLGIGKITVRGNFDRKPISPASAYFRYDYNAYQF